MGEKTPEQWQFVAKEYYQFLCERRDMSTSAHIGYGKWLLATLVAVHGGAIVAISNFGSNAGQILLVAGWYFLAGLMLAILSAFCAWLNFQFAEHAYAEMAQAGMIYDKDDWPAETIPHETKITATLWLAAGLGIVSWLLIAVGTIKFFYVFPISGAG